jgi:A/G-specific adenine glycosylase
MTELTAKDKAGIRRKLLAWYDRAARDLPWRRTRDPYAIWLSEIMLQQTRVEQGIPYFHRFLEAFPSVEALAQAPADRVLKAWEGLGYYSRARNLHKAAQVVAREHGGIFPRTVEALNRLPGVGRYTAGAIASIAYGVPAPVLDGNVKRILSRLFNVSTAIDDHATTQALWARAEALVPRNAPGEFNQALMDLGATVCTPRNPRCDACPVATHCRARAEGVQEERPVRRPRKPLPKHELVAGIVRRGGKYLLGKRGPNGMLSGLWEFPGGAVLPGESHADALRRILRDQLGIEVRVLGLVASVDHGYSHMKVNLTAYRCELVSGVVRPTVHEAVEWVPRSRLGQYAFPMVNRKFLHLV